MEIGVIVPTLNERDNIAALIEGILQADARLHVVVVDDGSQDGTSEYVETISRGGDTKYCDGDGESRVHLLARGQRLGYASAVQDGMRYAMQQGAQLILQMDADFSHHPRYLPALLEKSRNFDLVIGSRYVRGGGTRNWGIDRKLLSSTANALARTLLSLPARDCTGGFRVWKRTLIEASGVLDIRVQGYAFLFVSLDLCRCCGAAIGEVPIIFVDREHGHSKMSRRIIREAIQVLWTLWWKRIRSRGLGFGRSRRVADPSLFDTQRRK